MESEQIPHNHPNPGLSDLLMQAAEEDKLTPELIKETLGLDVLPVMEGNSAAYINWSTTAVVEGPAPAKVWFAGAGYDLGIVRSPDIIRDTHSVGIYYWWVNTAEIRAHPDKEYWFWVRQRRGMLFIDIYTPSGGSVAVYKGTQTENTKDHLVNYTGSFYGKGLWGFVV